MFALEKIRSGHNTDIDFFIQFKRGQLLSFNRGGFKSNGTMCLFTY